ncbi:MAG: hypothetical protein V4503_01455 [Gemmatimonadota bacterium]
MGLNLPPGQPAGSFLEAFFAATITALFRYSPRQFAQGELVLAPVFPVVLVALLLLAALALVAYSASRLQALSRRDRIFLALLRSGVLLIVAGALLRPSLLLSRAVPQRNVLAIAIDDSRSMRLTDLPAGSRLSAVQQRFADSSALVRRLGDRFVLRFYRFAGTASPLPRVDDLTGHGTRTDLAGALAGIRQDLADLPLAGVILVSDGADNGTSDLEPSLLALRARRVPVFTVGVGRKQFDHDLGLERLTLPPTTLAGGGVAASVLLRARGAGGDSIQLAIEADGRLVGTENTVMPRDRELLSVSLRIPPLEDGMHRITVRALPLRGESVTENNLVDGLLQVRPAGEKVLYVEGEPRPEFAFLRRALMADSAIQLVGLLQSAKGKYLRLGVDDSLELRDGFPVTREALFRYRVLVLGSVEASFFTGDQLRMLADFVSRRGGTLIALGGRGAFAEGGWSGTPLADLLPITFESRATGSAPDAVELAVHPTSAGAVHPALWLGPGSASLRRWDSLPALTAVNRFGQIRPGATVLLAGKAAGGNDIPVLSVERFGRGMAAVFGVQDSWRWQMSPLLPVDDVTHSTLWRQLLRWSLDQVPSRVDAGVLPDHADPGQAVEIVARVADAEYNDLNDAHVVAHVTTPSGVERELPMEWTLRDDGSYRASYGADEVGSYRVVVESRRGADTSRSAATSFVADTLGADIGRAELRTSLLQRIADATGGRYYSLASVDRVVDDAQYTAAGIVTRDAHDLWNIPVVLLFLVLLLGVEWAFRRFRGLS